MTSGNTSFSFSIFFILVPFILWMAFAQGPRKEIKGGLMSLLALIPALLCFVFVGTFIFYRRAEFHTAHVPPSAHVVMPEVLSPPKIELQQATPVPAAPVQASPSPPSAPSPAPTPKWITESTKPVGEIWRTVIEAGPYATTEEARQQAIVKGVAELLKHLGVTSLEALGLSPAQLAERVIANEHFAKQQTSVGEMHTAHLQLELDPNTAGWLAGAQATAERRGRVRQVGGLGALVLGGIAVLLGLLKFDETTQGRHRKRLFLGGPAAIIGAVAMLLW